MLDDLATRPRVVIAYLLDLRSHAQIMDRAASQVAVFNAEGLNTTGVCVDRGLPGEFPQDLTGLRADGPRLLRAFLEMRRLRRWLKQEQPALVIVRYGFATGSLLRIARTFPTILEIHSDDTHELPARRMVRAFAKVSALLYRRRLMLAVRGAMFVSSALEELAVFADLPGPRSVIPNGIRVPAEPLPAPTNDRPIVGYSVGYDAPWQGLDRLVALSELLPDFDFHLVVPDLSIADAVSGSRIAVLVAKDPEHYRSLIATFDVALGGLALDRKGIELASALKVRESVALGIPTLLFSRDEDLEEIESATVATVARGAWDPIALAPSVREFVLNAHGTRVPDELRHLVDIGAKAQTYARLASDVIGQTSDSSITIH